MSAVSTPRLRIELQQSDERVLVFPEGDVDLSSYDEFRAALTEAVTAGRPHVVVDLARVTFIDSMGLGALVSGLRDANEKIYGRYGGRDAKSPVFLTRSSTSCWRVPTRRRPSTRTASSTG